METIAVYWEPVVRIYGFEVKPAISLLHLKCDSLSAARLLEEIDAPDSVSDHKYIFSQMQMETPELCHLYIAATGETTASLRNVLEQKAPTEGLMISVHEPVDLLFFHGPHFQDRYGIASNVFNSLDKAVSVYTIGCTGTSIFIVTGPDQANLAREKLTQAFSIPIV